MQYFIRRPSIDLFPGVRVTKETVLECKNDSVEQKVEALVMHTVYRAKGENYESVSDVTLRLEEGDILIYDGERGYIKPVESFVSIDEGIDDLTNIKGVEEENV